MACIFIEREQIVHIRVQQRNNRQCLTTIDGLHEDYDHKKILNDIRRTFVVNGSLQEDPEGGTRLVFTGDQREKLRAFLIDLEICTPEQIRIMGW